MGLLSQGTSLSWEEIKKKAEHIRLHGLDQLIILFKKLKEREKDLLKWGDEIEYQLVYLDHTNKDARLALLSSSVLPRLQEGEERDPENIDSLWRVEYAAYMVEGTPGKPFCCTLCRLRYVETSMYLRRLEAKKVLEKYPNVKLMNYAVFPRIGCTNFTEPRYEIKHLEDNKISRSLYYPDQAIYPAHPRFHNLTRNIRERRGKKQQIYVPIWKDEKTPSPFYDYVPYDIDDGEGRNSLIPDHVYMDCMGFGMGCCCLQVTLQACNITEAKILYDQLVVLAPILLPLTAASPIWKGILCEYDCRWSVISGSVDDRNVDEYAIADDGIPKIPKSRYDTVDMYLSPEHEKFNDIRVEYRKDYLEKLVEAGMEEQLAMHFSHLFIRDPISAFKEKLYINNEKETDHFENIQSTNWQSCRFKPPPPNSPIGWRVEFRTLETQLTDFENASYVVFIILLTRLITNGDLDMIIPISRVDENMSRAIYKDAVNKKKFFFRSNIKPTDNEFDERPCAEMSLNTIINGDDSFIGLVPLVKQYIDDTKLHIETRWTVNRALDIISRKASGEFMTVASWIRDFVTTHPSYKQDSFVPKDIVYDLSCEIDKITNGVIGCPKMFGDYKQLPITHKNIDEYREMLRCQTHVSVTEKNSSESYSNVAKSSDFESTDHTILEIDKLTQISDQQTQELG